MNQDNRSSRQIAPELQRLVNAVRASQNADDMFDEGVVAFLGVSRSDGRCLDIVDRLGRITAGRLAAESGLSTGAVTALVDRLERVGYLKRTRDTEDRRRVWIESTPVVKHFNAMLFGHLGEMMPPFLDRFTPDQMEAITVFLEVGTWINRQRAALLQEHLILGEVTEDQRMLQAEAFDAEAQKMSKCIAEQFREGKLPHAFADPEADED